MTTSTIIAERIQDGFVWMPLHLRSDRLGLLLPPRTPDPRIPKYWLARRSDSLYFVNNTDEVLDVVDASSGGFISFDDGTAAVTGGGYRYLHVAPGEAVKVEEFDPVLDSDYVLQVVLRVVSRREGTLEIRSPTGKGGIGETVLLWSTGEPGKWVVISRPE